MACVYKRYGVAGAMSLEHTEYTLQTSSSRTKEACFSTNLSTIFIAVQSTVSGQEFLVCRFFFVSTISVEHAQGSNIESANRAPFVEKALRPMFFALVITEGNTWRTA